MSLEQLIQKATTDPNFAEALRTDEMLKAYFATTEADLRKMPVKVKLGFCRLSTSPFK